MCAQKNKQSVPAKEFGVKMKLGVKDRVVIPQILPKEGNFIQQRLVRDIMQKTELSQDEMEFVEMKSSAKGGVIWEKDKEKELRQKSVKFTGAEIGFLKDSIKKLDETEKINQDTLDFCERVHNLVVETGKEKESAPTPMV